MAEEPKETHLQTRTIFDINSISIREQNKALKNFFEGRTPPSEVFRRTARGGDEVKYCKTYYMTRQINLITGSRWSNEALEERYRPNPENPIEVGVKVKVTIWDKDGNSYVHTAWGQKDVAKYAKDDPKGKYKAGDIISLFDDLKAAESDGIKKALSYFGIANDIYGGKELEFFTEESATGNGSTAQSEVDFTSSDAYKAFGRWLEQNHVRWSKAYEILRTDKIINYKEAHDVIKTYLEKENNK